MQLHIFPPLFTSHIQILFQGPVSKRLPDSSKSRIKILLRDCICLPLYYIRLSFCVEILDLRIKNQQCFHYFSVDMRTLPTMYLILGLNLTLLQGTVPSARLYSNAHNTLQSLVSPLYSHIPRALQHIPSTPLNRPCAPIYPRTFYISPLLSCIVFVSQISPYPSTYPLHSFVSSFHSHIYPYPSTYTLYSLVSSFFSHISLCSSTYPLYYLPSSLYSHISPYPFTHTLYSLMSSLYSHISPHPSIHIPSTPICRLCFLMYPRAFLPTPSTPLYRPYTLIYSSLLIIPLMNL